MQDGSARKNGHNTDYLVFFVDDPMSIVVRRELFVDVEMPGLYHCEDGAVVPQLLVKAKR